MEFATTTTTPVSPDQGGLEGLQQMGIHGADFNGIMNKLNPSIAHLYQQAMTFSIEYGGMVLVLAGIIWLFAWKIHWSVGATWAKRLITGVFTGEIIVLLLPQLFYGLVAWLSKI